MFLSGGRGDGDGVTSCHDSCQPDPPGINWGIFFKTHLSQRGFICSIFSISNPLIRSHGQQHITVFTVGSLSMCVDKTAHGLLRGAEI